MIVLFFFIFFQCSVESVSLPPIQTTSEMKEITIVDGVGKVAMEIERLLFVNEFRSNFFSGFVKFFSLVSPDGQPMTNKQTEQKGKDIYQYF